MLTKRVRPTTSRKWLTVLFVIIAATAIGLGGWLISHFVMKTYIEAGPPTTYSTGPSLQSPSITVSTVAGDLKNPWGIAFLDDGQLIVTEREGRVSKIANGKSILIQQIPDVKVGGEGGLMGVAVDAAFNQNRFIYACFNSMAGDIRVARFKVNNAVSALEQRNDIVRAIPANPSGRHSGCQLAFSAAHELWIGTGDSAQSGKTPQTPQDPKSLGGKILRVDRNGKGISGNLTEPFDNRIYSFGHRNTQGIALWPSLHQGLAGYTAEHGSILDDEVNELRSGNFGWDPDIRYTENGVSMTDTAKFPDAILPVWKSGSPTQAPSGLTLILGEQWKSWQGSLAMSMLKARHLKILLLNNHGKIIKEEQVLSDKGRLRAVTQGPNGDLYVSTDNSVHDEILRITPQ